MNKKIIVTSLITLIVLLEGCSNGQAEQVSIPKVNKNQAVSNTSQTKNNTMQISQQIADNKPKAEPNLEYSIYKGKWICGEELNTSTMVMKNGGKIIDIQEINGGHIKGTFMSVQKSTNRVASTDFEGTIFNNILDFSFDNDGFYGKGKCSITFEKDKISVNVSTTVSADNASGWNLGNGNFIFINDTIATSKNFKKDMNISEEEAVKIINQLIEQKKIVLTEPNSNCKAQNFGRNIKDSITYYVIRVAYIDPNNKENTETLARYWVSITTRDVFQEDLWTGELSKVPSST